MSKVTMPEPVAYPSDDWVEEFFGNPDETGFYSFRGDFGNIAYRFQLAAQAGDFITTDQAEAYAEARVREVQRWQPIETAPKDGTAILLSNECGAWMAKYDPVYPSGYRPENPWFSLMLNHDHMCKGKPYAPTHWMPLPTPPKPTPW